MRVFPHKEIDAKWQKKWLEEKTFEALDAVSGKENAYYLVEFPYPSGDLHVGHWYAFSVTDIAVRQLRMKGKNVLFPIGFDAFGLPAENAAIKHSVTPADWTIKNMETMTTQLEAIGASFDWSRKLATCDPEYYRWTQWLFLKLHERGLAYRGLSAVNWCPKDQTVLANEQVVGGLCERCGSAVEAKQMTQWMYKITAYAEKLLDGLQDLPWNDEIKDAQRNWIGKSEGARIRFEIRSTKSEKPNYLILHGYTGRADKNFIPWLKDKLESCGYDVQAPQMPNTQSPKESEQVDFVIKSCRIDQNTVIIGHSLGGVVAMKVLQRLNRSIKSLVLVAPAKDPQFSDGEARPYWEEFAWDFDYELIKRLASDRIIFSDSLEAKHRLPYLKFLSEKLSARLLETIAYREHFCGVEEPYILQNIQPSIEIFTTRPDTIYGATFLVIGPEHKFIKENTLGFTNVDEVNAYSREAAKRKTEDRFAAREKTGVKLEGVSAINPATGKEIPVFVADYVLGDVGTGAIMAVPAHDERDHEFARAFNLSVIDVIAPKDGEKAEEGIFTGRGTLINSGDKNGLTSEDATVKILSDIGGAKEIQYRLHDWILSRQRYWGAPIPVVYDPEGNAHPVKEEHLPWLLPTDVEFLPTGESPLKGSREMRERVTRLYGEGWTPEFDTMDTFVDSSWYFLRYLDSANAEAFASRERMEAWLPVDVYSGGAEHTTMHLLYSRFFMHALYDAGLVPCAEPYNVRRNRGIILGTDGNKMSKSKGNVINPDEFVEKLGSDAVRMYMAFIGPYNEVGSFPWNTDSILGVRRFLDRVWKYALDRTSDDVTDTATLQVLHETVKKVTESIENFSMNTGVAQLMILFNHLTRADAKLSDTDWGVIVRLLSPYAPHMADELWENMGHSTSVALEPWPAHDASLLARAQVNIAVQVNGKVRDTFEAAADASKEELERSALASEKVQKILLGKSPAKVVVVPGRIVNIVLGE